AYPFGRLLLADETVGPAVDGFGQLAVVLNVLVERDLLRAVAPPPPALAVPSLVDHNAVDPCPQAGVATEGMDHPKDPQEDLLREVQRFVVIVEEVEGELVPHALGFAHQLSAGVLAPGRAPLDEGGFAAPDVGPCNGANRLH